MAYIYEQDVTKVGGNLQKTVAYLLSLHKNEYEWNLLGIKVIGVKEALPIPDGTYDYGDAYMIGNKTDGFELWIYTRADEFHSEAYWFDVGQFPKAGPKGDKGDGVETFTQLSLTHDIYSGDVYGSNNGQLYNGKSTIQYKDSTTGETKSQDVYTSVFLPIVGSDYVKIDGDAANSRFVVRLDDTALALDYIKLDKTRNSVIPEFYNGKIQWDTITVGLGPSSVVQRDANNATYLGKLYVNRLATTAGEYDMPLQAAYYGGFSDGFAIEKTPTDTGTLTAVVMDVINAYPNAGLKYDNQSYVRMNPIYAPYGTLNFIHLDSIDDGNGGYKATGKCFIITTSTREWKVVDLEFGGKVYQHAIHFTLTGSGNSSTANVWDIELVITTSSPNQITKDTLYKYISTSSYPLQGGTPISVYRERVSGPQGMGIGKMAVQHEVGEISNTDHYIFDLMSMDGISETIIDRDQNSLSSFVDTVTEV